MITNFTSIPAKVSKWENILNQIPDGKALEIEFENGDKPASIRNCIVMWTRSKRGRELGVKVRTRISNGRLYVWKV